MGSVWGNAQIGGIGSQGTEARGEHDTDVTDVDREMERVENVVDDTTRGHETWIDSTTHDTSERVPCRRVEPVPEFLLEWR